VWEVGGPTEEKPLWKDAEAAAKQGEEGLARLQEQHCQRTRV
jgi:hypothetical protein